MNKKRVRTLLRVSSAQQLHNNDIPVQRAEVQKYIQQKTDWQFDHEYIEKAVSAYKNSVVDREVLGDILEDAKQHKFDVLLTFMSDRIGRKDEYSMYIAALNKFGVEVWTTQEGQLATEADIDRLILFIKFWANERESRKTGERVKAAQQEMIKQGKHVGGKAPYGYELVYNGEIGTHNRAVKELQIVEAQAVVVREIFRLAVEEHLGAFAIAKRLNERHIPSINGGEWKTSTISDRLKNPIYMGYLTYNRRSHKDTYKRNPVEEWILSEKPLEQLQIVSPDIWHKAQELREKRKASINNKKEGYPVTTRGCLPLMGLLYCASCGCKLTNGSRYDQWKRKDGTKGKKMARKYKCTQHAGASVSCNGAGLYSADSIEPIIFAEVNKYMSKLKQSNVYEDVFKSQEEAQKKIEKDIYGLQKKLENIKKDIETLKLQIPRALRGEGVLSEKDLSESLEINREEKLRIEEQLNQKQQDYNASKLSTEDIDKFRQFIPNWEQEFNEAPTHMKKLLLSKIVERIEIDKENIKIVFKISEDAFQKENLPRNSSGSDTTLYTLCSA